MAQITDLQQFTASVGEVDSKNQPVTGDNLAWTIDKPPSRRSPRRPTATPP